MKSVTIELETLACPSCIEKIEAAIKQFDGVEKDTVKVLFNSSKAKFNFNENITPIKDIETAINKIGYGILKTKVK